ncbi:hypothetical protein M569_12718 [Genlisea aurea]|uniref:Anthocyanin acyltransferase n=1 Tax=Genlisea aurea TaxID=192259 RepID=S8DGX0_9LAMI|nr:hypothetical protein M569_12718 [Genlisea aurea]
MISGAAVLDRLEIQPWPATTAELTLPLVHFDMPWLYFHPVQRLLFFRLSSSSASQQFKETVVPRIRESLATTLRHFLPLAGKIVIPSSSARPFIRYDVGDSVPLVVAQTDKDFGYFVGDHPKVADDFHICVPDLSPAKHFSDGIEYPVLALQITLFPEKGYCLGLTNSHAIGDANSVVRFIKAWASACRFSGNDENPIERSSLPYLDRTAVEDPEGLDSIYWNQMKVRPQTFESPPMKFPLNRVRSTFVLTRENIQSMKSFFLEKRPELPPITSFVAASALIWSCLAKADPEEVADGEPEYFGFAADGRSRLNPPVPNSYFGNCLIFIKAVTTHGALRGEEGFLTAAELIGEAIRAALQNERGVLEGAETWMEQFFGLLGKRIFGIAGSPRFDLYDADFGWGSPEKYEAASIDADTSMSLCKSRDLEGGLEVGLSRPAEIINPFTAIFHQELRKIST